MDFFVSAGWALFSYVPYQVYHRQDRFSTISTKYRNFNKKFKKISLFLFICAIVKAEGRWKETGQFIRE
ncbi:MAG: hypothetical protein HFG51_02770 [Lachnospiraceae bacterium]|nr:hypothetical protein [Lachnospiraceae bacterium]